MKNICNVSECSKNVHGNMMCLMHYKRFKKHGTTDKHVYAPKNRLCSHDNCQKKHDSHGLCANHARQLRKYGHVLTDKEKSANRSKAMRNKTYVKRNKWHISEDKKYKGLCRNTGKTHFVKGTTPWNKGLKGYRAGEVNHLWKGGVTNINHKIRNSMEYKLWRKSVFERDGYKCIECGDKTSGNLNADHIKPFALFPELRFDINNGRTLCVPCHKLTDSYMNRRIKKEQYA